VKKTQDPEGFERIVGEKRSIQKREAGKTSPASFKVGSDSPGVTSI